MSRSKFFNKSWCILFLLFFINNNVKIVAQTIENPAFSRSDVPAFHITKVKITEDTTYVYISYYAEAGSWASISKETYLRDSKSPKTFPLLRCEGLPYSPETRTFPQNESCELLFCFPSISGTEQFDFIESEGERAFNIYDISLNKQFKTSFSDEELKQISEMVSEYDPSGDTEKTMLFKDNATSLNNLVGYNASIGNYAEAIRLGTVEVAIREKVFGNEDPSYIESLGSLAEYYAVLGNYNEAIRLGSEEVEIRKKIFGTESLNYVNSLENLASYNRRLGNLSEAIRLQQEVTIIKKEFYGIDNIEYANSLTYLAGYYSEVENYDEAIKFGTETMDIYKRVLGTDNPNYATILSNLAFFYSNNGNYRKAIQLEKEAMEILKVVLGAEHPNYAMSLSRLAKLNSTLGNYTQAVDLENDAMKIYRNAFGKEDPIYATSLNDLSGYYQDVGNYDETLKLLTEAMEIYKKVFGTESKYYAISLNNLAVCNLEIGNYSEAIRLGIEVMELYKKVFGAEHSLYALSLSNLANYYSNVGNYSESIKLVTEAMDIYRKTLGTEHRNYAASLNILAINNSEIGNYSEAIRLGTEAMKIYQRVLGIEHPEYARSLNSLAWYHFETGDYNEGIRLGSEAMEIRKRVLGMEHPLYATSLNNLANYNLMIGNYPEAIKLETETMEIFKRVLGTGHPFYVTSLGNLARFYSGVGNYVEAYNCQQQCLINSQSVFMRNITNLSSRNQETMWVNDYAYRFNTLFPNFVMKYQAKKSISELYDKTCLFAKGILLNTSLEMRKLILESGDSVIIGKYNALSSNISMYNKLLEKPIKERFMDADSLNSIIERQEMELARESKTYGDYTHDLTINWKDVQRRLGDNDIAIEFLDFPVYNTDSTLYVALTLKKDYDSPHMVTLFERNQLKAIPENVYYTQTDVSDLVWKPLEEELSGVKNIYFAPSGELHKIGIEYLSISKTENINEVYTLHRLSSTRQLAVVQDETKGENNILYGGINYDEKSYTDSTDSASPKGSIFRSALVYRANVDSLSLRNSFEYLEGTKKEVDLIAEDMKRHSVPYIYYSGTDGTEESFKKLDGTRPKVMHIATHGFYFTEEESEKSHFAHPEMILLTDDGPQVGRFVEHKPMTRSGLLFSGCNRVIHHEQIPDGEEDGILTAQEISTLDLRGLDLVVLSACQTGLGDIISGEGVFGLQRGFKKAGAKTIIMSLWNVNDELTMKMMTSFYHHYLDGMSKEEAFHAAQDELRKDNSSQQERPDWASFIMLDGLN